MNNTTRTNSKTASFGTTMRQNHDSTDFYKLKMLNDHKVVTNTQKDEVEIKAEVTNKIYTHDSRKLNFIPDNSVHLMITSPPYNVGKDYDKNLSFQDYRKLMFDVWKETYRILAYGGRMCINIANVGRKPYIPLHMYIIEDCLKLGFLMRGEIIWQKTSGAGGSCAWGSWKSAKNPILRDTHEYILVFSKGDYSRLFRGISDITSEEFMRYTQSIWTFPPESARRVKHPAPFPLELPRRLIKLYSYVNDIVIDPFNGSGSTCIAAKQHKRRYIGVDIDPKYNEIAMNRLTGELPFEKG